MSLRGKAVEVIVEDELEPTTAAVDDALDDGATIAMTLVFATGVGALMGVVVGLDPFAVVIYTYFAVAIVVALLAAGIRHSLAASEAQLDAEDAATLQKRLVPIAVAERRAEAARAARLVADEEAWRARESKRDQRLLDRELERHALAEREFAAGAGERKRAYPNLSVARQRLAYVLPRAVSSRHADASDRIGGDRDISARDRGWFDNPITGVHDNLILTNGTGRPMTGRVIVPSVLCANKSFSLAAGATETVHSNCTPREIRVDAPAVGVIPFPAVATHRDRPAKLTVILTSDGRIASVAPSGYYHG